MIYLDNAATTEMGEDVLNVMIPFLSCTYGNPSSKHLMGVKARKAVENAREQVAISINANADQIIFTSGGSEGNSSVFALLKHVATDERKDVVITNAEHESVFQSARCYAEDLCSGRLLFLNINNECQAQSADLEEILSGCKAVLVSTIFVNNETGAVNDVSEMARICHKYGALFHVDCVQALGNVEVDVQKIDCDFATFSGHKIHGPKGIGALYVKDRKKFSGINSLLINGTQESGWRGGTENVPGIVGFGKACENINGNHMYFKTLRNEFTSSLMQTLDKEMLGDIISYNTSTNRCDKILSITFDGVDAETLLAMLADKVCISAGSACHANEQTPSRVLIAMGLTEEQAHNTIRVSFSKFNSIDEVRSAGEIIANAVIFLKSHGM